MGAQRGSQLAESASRPAAAEGETSSGRVFWITGLSGAGKTTIGRELWRRLRAAGHSAIFLDGDTLREVIARDLGHSHSNRRESAMRNARLCQMLSSQGHDVVCPTISLFHEVQRWSRENIPNYREIYLRVPMIELRRRDPKGIYAAAHRGDLPDVVGLDVPAELPEAADLTLDNFGNLDSAAATDRIWTECVMRNDAGTAGPAGRRHVHHQSRDAGDPGAAAAQRPDPPASPLLGCRMVRRSRPSARQNCGPALELQAGHRPQQRAGRGWPGKFPSRTLRFGTGRTGQQRHLGCNRPGHRFLRRERKQQ